METLFIILFVAGVLIGAAKIAEVLRKPDNPPEIIFRESEINIFGEKIIIIPAGFVQTVEESGLDSVSISFISQTTGKKNSKIINTRLKYNKSPQQFIDQFRRECINSMVLKDGVPKGFNYDNEI